ncbi:hypothetical protein LCGC14_1667000 [marine sediment metagenome]|uniref:Uncharacterized protein n=1 Tax=marine sediment metagenome TaxID=412755 RepID=A0A0F9HSD5_9ZZZZ
MTNARCPFCTSENVKKEKEDMVCRDCGSRAYGYYAVPTVPLEGQSSSQSLSRVFRNVLMGLSFTLMLLLPLVIVLLFIALIWLGLEHLKNPVE